jgi:hypothetical protein
MIANSAMRTVSLPARDPDPRRREPAHMRANLLERLAAREAWKKMVILIVVELRHESVGGNHP